MGEKSAEKAEKIWHIVQPGNADENVVLFIIL